MKLQVGDLVRIKDNAYEIKDNNIWFADEMKIFCGQEHKIKAVGDHYYKLEDVIWQDHPDMNDDGHWMWAEEWVEFVEPVKVTITDDELLGVFE